MLGLTAPTPRARSNEPTTSSKTPPGPNAIKSPRAPTTTAGRSPSRARTPPPPWSSIADSSSRSGDRPTYLGLQIAEPGADCASGTGLLHMQSPVPFTSRRGRPIRLGRLILGHRYVALRWRGASGRTIKAIAGTPGRTLEIGRRRSRRRRAGSRLHAIAAAARELLAPSISSSARGPGPSVLILGRRSDSEPVG